MSLYFFVVTILNWAPKCLPSLPEKQWRFYASLSSYYLEPLVQYYTAIQCYTAAHAVYNNV